MTLRPRSVRGRLLAATMLVTAAGLTGVVALVNVVLDGRLSRQATALARADAGARIESLAVRNGRIVLPSAPDPVGTDNPVWVFTGGRLIDAPTASPALNRAAVALAAHPERSADVAGLDLRLAGSEVRWRGRRIGAVIAATSLAPYEETQRSSLIASVALAVGTLVLVAVTATWTLRRALRPVSDMTTAAETWSERDVGRRFGLGPPHDELTQLAATLDRLLDRIAESLRHEQRFTAELSHELRTPLARIRTEAELALRRERDGPAYREALSHVLRNAEQLGAIVDALLAAARHEASLTPAQADARAVADRVVEAAAATAGERGVRVGLYNGAAALAACEPELLERILQPLVDNACRYARSRASVGLQTTRERLLIRVTDDGPGVQPGEEERIFEPGRRGSAARTRGVPGSGLGLALARRLARSAGGDIRAGTGDGGSFVVDLPARRPPPALRS